jgi:Tol biopolymer transport system component
LRPLLALLTLGLLAGCDGGGDERAAPMIDLAPPQPEARLAAVRLGPGNPPRFAVISVDDHGSNLRVLAEAPSGSLERLVQAAWSPDTKRVYFVGVLRERSGEEFRYYESDVFVVDANGGERRRLTFSRDVRSVVPSPDGKTLLLGRDDHPARLPFTTSLWIRDEAGGNVRRLFPAKDGQLDLAGSWSPDGRTIAFTRCTFEWPGEGGLIKNTCAVYTVSRDGSDLRELADRSSQPAFSPDGRSIAFVSDRDEHGKHATGEDENAFAGELYVMDADGHDQQRLTETETLDEAAPTWSPDGSRMAFEREGPARFTTQLMIVKADGTCPTRLIGDAERARVTKPWFTSPAWRPGRLTGTLATLDCD